MAEELNCTPAQVAIKWVIQNGKNNIPIVGARNSEQLINSLRAGEIEIHADQLKRLDEVSKIDLGFPHEFLKGEGVQDILFSGKSAGLEKRRS